MFYVYFDKETKYVNKTTIFYYVEKKIIMIKIAVFNAKRNFRLKILTITKKNIVNRTLYKLCS